MSEQDKGLLRKAQQNFTVSMRITLPNPVSSYERFTRDSTGRPVTLGRSNISSICSLEEEMREVQARQHLFSDERSFDSFDPFEREDAIHHIISEVLK